MAPKGLQEVIEAQEASGFVSEQSGTLFDFYTPYWFSYPESTTNFLAVLTEGDDFTQSLISISKVARVYTPI